MSEPTASNSNNGNGNATGSCRPELLLSPSQLGQWDAASASRGLELCRRERVLAAGSLRSVSADSSPVNVSSVSCTSSSKDSQNDTSKSFDYLQYKWWFLESQEAIIQSSSARFVTVNFALFLTTINILLLKGSIFLKRLSEVSKSLSLFWIWF